MIWALEQGGNLGLFYFFVYRLIGSWTASPRLGYTPKTADIRYREKEEFTNVLGFLWLLPGQISVESNYVFLPLFLNLQEFFLENFFGTNAI